jgi:hypothetical protein
VNGADAGGPRTRLRWKRRVVGFGPAVPALRAATAERLRAGARLRVAASPADGGCLLVLGAAEELPWADGARYLGRDGRALVPTTAEPYPCAALWHTALTAGGQPDRLVVLLPERALIASEPATVADPAALAALDLP